MSFENEPSQHLDREVQHDKKYQQAYAQAVIELDDSDIKIDAYGLYVRAHNKMYSDLEFREKIKDLLDIWLRKRATEIMENN